jgi:formylmethanofuran dehydrogenase subunit E
MESSSSSRSLASKYTVEQRKKLSEMSRDEKKEIQCGKCGEYFHSRKECPNPGRMCFACHRYGHELKDCKYNKQGNSKEK